MLLPLKEAFCLHIMQFSLFILRDFCFFTTIPVDSPPSSFPPSGIAGIFVARDAATGKIVGFAAKMVEGEGGNSEMAGVESPTEKERRLSGEKRVPSAARFNSGEPSSGMVVDVVEVVVVWIWKGEGLVGEERGMDGKCDVG